jgi:hypothetical protein
MPAVDIPLDFCGPTNVAQSPIFDGQTAMNCYCEKAEVKGSKSQIAMWHTPGKKLFVNLSEENSVPSTYTVNGRTFAAGVNLWELFANGTAINRGNIGTPPFTPTQMVANQTQLVILNNGNLYVFTLATNVLTPVNMAQFNGPVLQIDFSDAYVVAILQNSHTFQQSNISDATTWSGLNISTNSLFPDNFTSMKCDHREMWLYSAKKTAVYYNSGAGFPVFIPIQGAFLENGSGAAFATTQLDNSLFWLDQDERGNMVARRANGYNGQRISTHAVELAWQQYAVTSDAVGYSYQEQGHTFWVIYFPAANATWCYDVASGYWHQRGFWNQATGTYRADRSMCHTFNFGKHLVGDPFSGNVYWQSSSILDDNGSPIRGFRISPVTSKNNEWIYFQSIEFDIEVGLAPATPLVDGNGNPRPAYIILDWSDDGGKTWSNQYFLSLGFTGEYKKRVKKRFLGRARKRVWRVVWTDPVSIRFIGAYLRGELEAAA